MGGHAAEGRLFSRSQRQAQPQLRGFGEDGAPGPSGLAAVVVLSFDLLCRGLHRPTPQDLFWKPVVDTPGAVLLAVGGHPNGPPTIPAPAAASDEGSPTPVPSSDTSQTVPFADSVTLAYVTGALESRNKQVVIRRGNASSFSDLREGAAVLIGAFNNEWSLRLTRSLRFSLALDADRSLIYIKDATEPLSRKWSWATNQPRELMTGPNSPKIQDYALISRIRDAGTGHVVVVIGGCYTYGTQAAGEFLTNPDLMREAVSPNQQARRDEPEPADCAGNIGDETRFRALQQILRGFVPSESEADGSALVGRLCKPLKIRN